MSNDLDAYVEAYEAGLASILASDVEASEAVRIHEAYASFCLRYVDDQATLLPIVLHSQTFRKLRTDIVLSVMTTALRELLPIAPANNLAKPLAKAKDGESA